MPIYLDHGATTPTRPEVIALITEVMQSQWGNPSSLHTWGERAAMSIERARLQVADLLNADATNVIFTSGGTESDNLAIFGIARRYRVPQHMITSAVEHSAIEQSVKLLEQAGWQITRLPVNQQGSIEPADLVKALQPNTVLVSIIYGQNEVGTLQPIEKLGKICREAGVWFHTDAVQTVGRLPLDLQKLPVDLLSISSHKLYGPQGVGALFVRPEVELVPLLMGGGQENGMRSGTQPVASIAGFGLAAQLADRELETEFRRLSRLRDRLFTKLADIPDLLPIGASGAQRLPHHASFCYSHLNGRQIVRAMNQAGIAISAGSACSSGAILPSPVLLAMGFTESQALGAIRITLGKATTDRDIEFTAETLKQILKPKI